MMPVSLQLATFLLPLSPGSSETQTWGDLPLSIQGYLSDVLPASRWISSVRCVMLSSHEVLVARSPDSIHVLPGGRLESGESLLETLHREVAEETGWTVQNPTLLGLIHYHHLSPKPPDYAYPYPDFLQVVYCAAAGQPEPSRKNADDYEIEAQWMPFEAAATLHLSKRDRLYLQASIQRMRTL